MLILNIQINGGGVDFVAGEVRNIPVEIIVLNGIRSIMRQRDATVTGKKKTKTKNFTRSKVSGELSIYTSQPEMSWPVWSVPVFQSKCERVCLFLRCDTTQRCGATTVKVTPSALCIQMCEHPRSLLVTYLHSTLKVKTNQAIWITTAGNFHAFPRHSMSQRREHRPCIKLPRRVFSIPRVCCAFAAHLFASTSCVWGKSISVSVSLPSNIVTSCFILVCPVSLLTSLPYDYLSLIV